MDIFILLDVIGKVYPTPSKPKVVGSNPAGGANIEG